MSQKPTVTKKYLLIFFVLIGALDFTYAQGPKNVRNGPDVMQQSNAFDLFINTINMFVKGMHVVSNKTS
jgi:hypothetical protein